MSCEVEPAIHILLSAPYGAHYKLLANSRNPVRSQRRKACSAIRSGHNDNC